MNAYFPLMFQFHVKLLVVGFGSRDSNAFYSVAFLLPRVSTITLLRDRWGMQKVQTVLKACTRSGRDKHNLLSLSLRENQSGGHPRMPGV